MRPCRHVIPALPTVAAGAMALLAAVFVPLLPTYAQGNAASCANGIAVPNPSDNPGLVSDCEALLSARDTLAGTASLNWSSTTAIYQWDGVTVGGTPPRVIGLYLYQRQLTGKIASELGSLSKLEVLFLSANELEGEIPGELGRLVNLRILSLYSNRLTGTIPTELARLSDLRELDLQNNPLRGTIPPEIGKLSGLTLLSLRHNQLNGPIPPELGGLSNLEDLHLYGNQLSGEIPPELGSLSNLAMLDLGANQLNGPIPTELANLSNLTRIELHYNHLEGRIPPELGSISSLKELSLGQNRLSGPIPTELARLSQLMVLSLSNNQLAGGIPPELGSLSNLMKLGLDGNQLSGRIPLELTNLSNLKRLSLDHNQLIGEISPTLGRLSDLVDLRLSDNELTGQIPSELGNLGSLKILNLEANRLSGPIPPELGRLPNLWWLILGHNRLSGPIPAELGNLSNLTLLKLSGNDLSGEIPTELERLTNLTLLWLAHRKLEGCIPGRLRAVPRNDLHFIDLSFCDVLLSGLMVSPGSLTPSFDRHHTDYTVEVSTPNVTIHPISRYDATLEPLDEAGHEVADADVALPGIQIDAGAAFRGIRIKVVTADGKATRTYTIGIRRVLGAPTVAAVEAGGGYLAVSWAAPDEFAEARTASYDLRYIPTTDDEAVDANWTVVENVPTYSVGGDLQYTITGLSAGTQYEVQVRAVDRGGEPAAWSASVTGTPTTPSVCVTGGAVAGVLSAGIISDCESLLAARDALAGSGRLNWSASTPVKDWDGVTVGGTPPRVVGLSVNSRGLDGTIPAELGDLTGLRRLDLFENRLTGPIPAELGKLVKLQSLNLSDNRLTGQIPSQLGVLGELRSLFLQRNDLVGVIPSALGFLDDLAEADLSGNNLLGCAPPIANDHTGPPCFVAEGTTLTVDTSYLLTDDGARITSVGDASNGTVTLDGTTVTYRHDGSETTTGGFTYTVADGAQTMTLLVAISVSPVNDPPVGVTDALAVQEGGTVSVEARELLANDSDVEGDPVSITTVGDAANGLVALDGTTITYTHDGSETNAGGFTYMVTDGTDATTVLVTIAVSPVNDPPSGVDDALAVREGGSVSAQAIELLANDTDAEGDTLSITAVGDAINGVVTLDGNTIIYAHDGSETTAGSFTYTFTDGADSATASVIINVSPENDPPIGETDALAVQEGGTVSVQARELLANDTDPDLDTLNITAVGDATNGLVALDGDTIFYRHDGSETNAGSFTYTVSDGTDTATVLVTVSVSPVNDPPNGVDDALDVEEGDTVSIASQQLLANDSDAEGDALRITAVGDAINGVVTLDGNTIFYRHDGSETTSGSFAYTVSDGIDSTTALVTVAVRPVNDPPTGVDDAFAVEEGGMVTVQVQRLLDNDTDAEGDALRITAVGDAVNGVVTLDGGAISYAHDGSETTTGTFTYTVSDGTESAVASVTVTVSPVNDPPVGVDDTLAVREGGTLSVASQQLLANDTDAEGDALRITAVGDAINGVVTLDSNTITYDHDGSETTAGSFTYTVSDGTESAVASVTVTVSPVNDPPVGVDDTLAVREGGTLSVASQQLLANDTDAEGDALRITAVGDAINGVVTLDGNTISYEHDGSETLTGSFTYTVSDRTDSATVLVTISVSPVDDTPVLLIVSVALGVALLALGILAGFAVGRRRKAP